MEDSCRRHAEDRTQRVDDLPPVPHPSLAQALDGSHLTDGEAAILQRHESVNRQRSHDNVTRLADGYHLLGQLLQKLAHIENIAGRSELARQVALAVEPYIERHL